MRHIAPGLSLLAVSLAALPVAAQAPAAPKPAQGVLVRQLTVAATNDEWTPTGISVGPNDFLVFRAQGQATIGGWLGQRGPHALPPTYGKAALPCGLNRMREGTLTAKIGTGAALAIGAEYFWLNSEQSGELKLRIHDTRYEDNAGEISVQLIVVPAAVLAKQPSDELVVAATNDEWTPSKLAVEAGDFLILGAEGRYGIGSRTVTGDGTLVHPAACGKELLLDGVLTAKIGVGAGMAVGALHLWQAEQSGPLKFRIHDGKYADNAGEITVRVLRIPGEVILKAAKP